MNTTTLNSFVKEFVAIITGDDAEAKAQKAYRGAVSALKTQISSLEGDVITKEDAVEEAKSAFAKARVNNGQVISDRNQYVANLIQAKNNVTNAEEALATHQAKIEFLKTTLAEIQEEA